MRSSLIWVCTVCSDLSVPIFRIITVIAEKLSASREIGIWPSGELQIREGNEDNSKILFLISQ